MADNADSVAESQITFKVKTSGDSTHTITMSDSATVLDLKTKLAGEEFENIPVERQRLIYSGRVLKNDDTLATYKIKPNNTIHMVKSAASNTNQPASTSSTSNPAPQAVPTNMAAGTANNPLAGLTGARYAGHQINMPGIDMFGPDGGMGPPIDDERLQRMMEDPNVQQSMNEALNNPDFINMLIESNPMLRNIPNARELLTSPFMRQMMSNPQMISQAMRMQRSMRGAGSAFPAPGATDTTPAGAAASGTPGAGDANANAQNTQNPINPFASFGVDNPFAVLNSLGQIAPTTEGTQPPADLASMTRSLQGLLNVLQPANTTGSSGTAGATPEGLQGNQGAQSTQGATGTTEGTANQTRLGGSAADNPFAALFPGTGGSNNVPFMDFSPEAMRQMAQAIAAGGAPTAPADNRPPEERYADQLRQLNDMGFFDFDRNIAALRRSGGSVQGAVEYLLTSL